MKILLASDVLFTEIAGGSARFAWEMARAMARQGHTVYFLSRTLTGMPPEPNTESIRFLMYPWSPKAPWRSMLQARRMARSIAQEVDALHMHGPLSALSLFGLRGPFRYVYFFQSPWADEYLIRRRFQGRVSVLNLLLARIRFRIEHLVLSQADLTITLSRYMEGRLITIHHPSRPFRRIDGAVDIHRFAPHQTVTAARTALGWDPHAIHLLTVRNLEARMGIENLLDAFSHVKATEPHLHLHIVGEGSLRQMLTDRAGTLGISGCTSFHGRVLDEVLPLYYQAADLFVLPTRELEGFGLVTVEAMACGCPVVGTPVGATPEILGGLDESLLTSGATPLEIGQGIRRILERKEEWPALRQRCRTYAETRYSWEKVTGDVLRMSQDQSIS